MILNSSLKIVTIVLLFLSFNSWSKELNTLKCYDYLTELVRSSNFPFTYVTKEKINLLIDNDQGNKIFVKLTYDKEEKDRDRVNPNSTATEGWIEYDIKKQRLFNISAYLNEKPEELSFDKKYAIKFDQCRKQPEQVSSEIFCEKINEQIQSKVIHFPNPLETYTVIGKRRLYFYSAPDKNCKISNNLFVIPNDIVIPYLEYNHYYYVSYSENMDITGWVLKDRLQSTGKYLGLIIDE